MDFSFDAMDFIRGMILYGACITAYIIGFRCGMDAMRDEVVIILQKGFLEKKNESK